MWQVMAKHAYALGPTKSEWFDHAVQAFVWQPIRETSSNATRQGTLVHSHLSSLGHGVVILGLERVGSQADLRLNKNKTNKKVAGEE